MSETYIAKQSLLNQLPLPAELIEHRIFVIRGHEVMLDRDLAVLYEVRAIALRQQFKRNIDRFPADFVFQLSDQAINDLLSQNVILPAKPGGFPPLCLYRARRGYAFQRTHQQARGPGQHCHHASVCAPSGDVGELKTYPQTGRNGKEV